MNNAAHEYSTRTQQDYYVLAVKCVVAMLCAFLLVTIHFYDLLLRRIHIDETNQTFKGRGMHYKYAKM